MVERWHGFHGWPESLANLSEKNLCDFPLSPPVPPVS